VISNVPVLSVIFLVASVCALWVLDRIFFVWREPCSSRAYARKLHGTRGAIASGNIHSCNLPCPVHGSPYYHFVFEGFECLCYLPQTDESIGYGNNENQIDGANVSSYRENFLHLIERLVSSHVDPFLVCRVCSASSFLQAVLLAMRQGAMLAFLTCAISKGYLRVDEKLEDLTEERKKELRGVEMRDRRLTAVINKGMVPPGQDIHSMTKAEQDTLLKLESEDRGKKAINTTSISKGFSQTRQDIYNLSLEERGAAMKVVGQDAQLVVAHNKGFWSAATVLERTALSGAERGTSMRPAGQDAQLVAAHTKGFGSAETVLERNAISGSERGTAMKAAGQDAKLVAAHNKGFGSAATVLERNAISGAERGAAMRPAGQDAQLVASYTKDLGGASTIDEQNTLSEAGRSAVMKTAGQISLIVGGHKRGVPGVGTPEEYSSMPLAQQHEMSRLVHVANNQTHDQNLNWQGILSSAQILAQHKEEGLGAPVSAMPRIAKRSTTQTQGTQIEIDTALARGTEPSENEGNKSLTPADCIVVEFNQRLKRDCLMKSANDSEQNNEKLRVYLGSKGISTTGGLVGEKVFETMARLDKLLQKYRLLHKLDLIQKLEPIDARAFAPRKLPFKTKGRSACYVQQKNPKQESLFSCSLSFYSLSMEGMELGTPWSSRWSSRKIDTPIGQHVSKRPSTTRLAPTGLNLNKASRRWERTSSRTS